jgi:hypothetical protein
VPELGDCESNDHRATKSNGPDSHSRSLSLLPSVDDSSTSSPSRSTPPQPLSLSSEHLLHSPPALPRYEARQLTPRKVTHSLTHSLTGREGCSLALPGSLSLCLLPLSPRLKVRSGQGKGREGKGREGEGREGDSLMHYRYLGPGSFLLNPVVRVSLFGSVWRLRVRIVAEMNSSAFVRRD